MWAAKRALVIHLSQHRQCWNNTLVSLLWSEEKMSPRGSCRHNWLHLSRTISQNKRIYPQNCSHHNILSQQWEEAGTNTVLGIFKWAWILGSHNDFASIFLSELSPQWLIWILIPIIFHQIHQNHQIHGDTKVSPVGFGDSHTWEEKTGGSSVQLPTST